MEIIETVYFSNREDWRAWLEKNFELKDGIWLEYPTKHSKRERIIYNDAVEEALCFGWIDSTLKAINADIIVQHFTKRRKGSSFSQPNIERLKWLYENNKIHPSVLAEVLNLIHREFVFPPDIIATLKSDSLVWENYQHFSESYKRIRIAYIDSARKRPAEFQKRLLNFMDKTRKNTLIKGFGAIEKYY